MQFINDMETHIGSKWTLPCDGLGSGGLVKEGEHIERDWSTAGTINGSNNTNNGGGGVGTMSLIHNVFDIGAPALQLQHFAGLPRTHYHLPFQPNPTSCTHSHI
ncbi:hypothetical protein GYMLUDRAFT_696393 [Collybiopsis luxurians FD-317 M1]|uniref:Uncharacterized protein n=1 Tax=Collybiopsis luxurians FD-317 M1 TaxID=944289 RepID=A0A0D0CJD2_9AGAR|nr:hypothetical protein GYMLUDRAFT_696393 [Collybiopsis luxurians FD-317 M1]